MFFSLMKTTNQNESKNKSKEKKSTQRKVKRVNKRRRRMRSTRRKHVRKFLNHFRMVFGIKAPYNVIVDGNFLHTCMICKVGFREGLNSIFENVFPCVTACIVNELKNMGEQYSNAALIARRLQHVPCKHTPCVTPAECIQSIIGENNPAKVGVATQDKQLRRFLSLVGCVPIVFLNAHNIVSLEAPSSHSKAKAEQLNHAKVLGAITKKQPKAEAPTDSLAETAADATDATEAPTPQPPKSKKVKKAFVGKRKKLNPASIVIKKANFEVNEAEPHKETEELVVKKKRKRVHRKKPSATQNAVIEKDSERDASDGDE